MESCSIGLLLGTPRNHCEPTLNGRNHCKYGKSILANEQNSLKYSN